MSKVRSALPVLLSAALIVICAFFPGILSRYLDRACFSNPEFIAMDPVRLEIRRELTALERLTVLTRADLMLDISGENAAMSREQVLETAFEGIAPYADTLLITGYSDEFEMRPVLVQVQSQPELQAVVWLLSATYDPPEEPKQFNTLELAIDDETGSILAVSYTREARGPEPLGQEALSVFAEIYFAGLDIPDFDQHLVRDLESAYWGDNGDAARYYFESEETGRIYVDLNVHDHGFYVEFSES